MVSQMISFLYRMGFWHRGDEPTTKELVFKYFYCIYHFLFVISLVVGAITSETRDDSIFLAEIAIIATVLTVRLWTLVWRQNKIIELLNRICIFSIRCEDDVAFVIEKLNRFIRFVMALLIYLTAADCSATGVLPFIGREKTLFFKIGFPLDWRNNEIAFWIANFYVFTGLILSMAACLHAITVWYLMMISSLRYVVLGNELKKLGQISQDIRKKDSMMRNNQLYLHDLNVSIDAYLHTRE